MEWCARSTHAARALCLSREVDRDGGYRYRVVCMPLSVCRFYVCDSTVYPVRL